MEGAYPEHGRTQRPLDHLDDRPRDERQKERPRREPRVVQGEARKQTAARLAAKVPRGGGGSIVRLMGRNWGGYGGGGVDLNSARVGTTPPITPPPVDAASPLAPWGADWGLIGGN